MTGDAISFGPFRLFPSARVLERDGIALSIGSRCMDILIVLIERPGEVVKHRDLISRAWRGLVVDSCNLRVQVTYLRKSLGDGERGARYIANIPGQGYSFVAPVEGVAGRKPSHSGAFTLDAVMAIARERDMDTRQVLRAMDHLMALSLLSAMVAADGVTRYHLNDRTIARRLVSAGS